MLLRFRLEQSVMIGGAANALFLNRASLRLKLPMLSRSSARLHRARLMMAPAPLSKVSVVVYIWLDALAVL